MRPLSIYAHSSSRFAGMLQKYSRGIQAGGGVDAGRAVLLGNLRELVGDDVLLRILLRRVERLAQLLQLRRILPHALAVLGVVGRVRVFHLLQRHLFGRPVRRADLLGALEGEVLEHVRNAGLPGRIVRVAGIHQRVVGKDRRLGPLNQQYRQPLGRTFVVTRFSKRASSCCARSGVAGVPPAAFARRRAAGAVQAIHKKGAGQPRIRCGWAG